MTAITGGSTSFKYNLEVVPPRLNIHEAKVVQAAKNAIDSGLFVEAGKQVAMMKPCCDRISVTAELLDYIVFAHKENPLIVFKGTGAFLAQIGD